MHAASSALLILFTAGSHRASSDSIQARFSSSPFPFAYKLHPTSNCVPKSCPRTLSPLERTSSPTASAISAARQRQPADLSFLPLASATNLKMYAQTLQVHASVMDSAYKVEELVINPKESAGFVHAPVRRTTLAEHNTGVAKCVRSKMSPGMLFNPRFERSTNDC